MNQYQIPNLVKACEILRLLAGCREGISANNLEARVDIPRTTAFRILKTLCSVGMAEKRGSLYFSGPGLVQIGLNSLHSVEIRSLSIPYLRDLAMQAGLTAHLAIPSGQQSLILEVHDSPHPVRVASRPGTTVPLHCSSTGKVFLAYCYEDRIAEYFSQTSFTKFTDRTIVSLETMRLEIEQIKSNGYAVDDHEFHENVYCVAAPVRDSSGRVVAAIGVTGPSMQLSRENKSHISHLVKESANQLSTVMGYQ